MRTTSLSSLTLSVLLALATLLLPLGLVHAQQQQQKPSALASILSSDDSTANHHELGIDLRHRRHLYRAIEHFYASVVENNIQQNSNWRQRRRRIQRRDLLNEVLGDAVPTSSKDGSGSIEECLTPFRIPFHHSCAHLPHSSCPFHIETIQGGLFYRNNLSTIHATIVKQLFVTNRRESVSVKKDARFVCFFLTLLTSTA
ncbi:hypothetical protein K457DRAFT_497101 [Linnemannia elongata AG-77]|uniref:Uncharacterized protein n=1 Tax=Linnemannia elongata AG-77 TaxID=1314771 RepID=A0A197KEG7_9FUNG|nr:hypothetical protein K457DRAFT_497101 [Linnemannia elongata AG-77]